MDRKSAKKTNYFGELPTAYYDAVFKDGKFIDIQTGIEIKLKNDSPVRIQTVLSGVESDDDFERHLKTQFDELEVGFEGMFAIGDKDFNVELLEPLYLKKEGKRHSKLQECPCSVSSYFDRNGFLHKIEEPIVRGSLNSLYTAVSIEFFPEKLTHNCNVYKKFRFGGRKLEEFRKF